MNGRYAMLVNVAAAKGTNAITVRSFAARSILVARSS